MPAPDLERISPLATRARRGQALVAVDAELVRRKAADARTNPRRREIHVLHSGDHDPLQRMLNALQPGSYIRPHRHRLPPKAETLVLLCGRLAFVAFDDAGRLEEGGLVLLDREAGAWAVDCRAGLWHTFFALDPDTVLFEAKPGPYERQLDKEFPPWAPAEGAPEAGAYLAWLEDRFRTARGLGPRTWLPGGNSVGAGV